MADSAHEAKKVVLEEILPKARPGSIGFGGSMSVIETGVYECIKTLPEVEILDNYDR